MITGHSALPRLIADQMNLTTLRDLEETENNNNSDATPSKPKPVFNDDRQITYRETHTNERTVETESTKHNADKAVSCNSTATLETSQQEDFPQESRESSDKTAVDGGDYRIFIETESWRTAKNWKSEANRTDQGNYGGERANGRSSIFYFACF